MFLFINTAFDDKSIALTKNGKIIKKNNFKRKFGEAEKTLLVIDKILKSGNKKIEELKGIVVVSGPGAFTSLRIGITVANILAYSLNIPVKGVRLDELNKDGLYFPKFSQKFFFKPALPIYGKEPNITISSKM